MSSTRRISIPAFLPQLGWSLNHKGYVIYTSKRRPRSDDSWPLRRGAKLHREVVRYLAKHGPLRLDLELLMILDVHHQDGDPLNNCPCNLIIMPRALNIAGNCFCQCPITGRYLSKDEWERVYGSS